MSDTTVNKKEIIVLLILIFILISINIVGFIKKQNLKRDYEIIVKELTVQISINEASIHELEDLPGIGPSLAKRIVNYRRTNGRFETLESMKEVKGIGDKVFKQVLPYIRL